LEELTGLLNKFSLEDVEKLRALFSIVPTYGQKEIITLRIFCDEYRNLIKSNRSNNYYNSVNLSLNHLTNYFGEQRSISSLSIKDIELFITDLQKQVPKGFRVYYRTLKASFNKAADWNYINVNPFVKVKLPKQQKTNPTFINEDQLRLIISNIDVEIVRKFIIVAFKTGMRLSELVNLRWRNVDFENRIITVGDELFETKGRNQRYVPICDEVFEILEKRKTKDVETCRSEKAKEKSKDIETENVKTKNVKATPSLVLPLKNGEKNKYVFYKDNGMPFTGDYFSKRFKRACRNAGLDEAIHFHTLRHSFASNLAQQGVSLYVIKELLGHSSITTTEIYAHLNVDSLREAISKLNVETNDVKIKPPLNLPLENGETFKKSSTLKLIKYKG